MADITQLVNSTTTAVNLGKFILATPQANNGYQPQSSSGGNGSIAQQNDTILFDYEGEQTFSLQSDITDHYSEDNTALQDQIALRPEVVTTGGFVGELNDVLPPGLSSLKFAADKLIALEAYEPELTVSALVALQQAIFQYSSISTFVDNAQAAWNTINGNTGNVQNKQQKMFARFYGYWKSRTLFSIQTPWNQMQDMAIQALKAVQDADSNVVTEFSVTFKKMQFASNVTVRNIGRFDFNNFQNRAFNQGSPLIDYGVTPTASSSVSPSSLYSGVTP